MISFLYLYIIFIVDRGGSRREKLLIVAQKTFHICSVFFNFLSWLVKKILFILAGTKKKTFYLGGAI
jgi:hypothetical protein